MRVAVTFEMGCVLERDADKNVVHKDPADFFPAPQAVFLYDEQALPTNGKKTLRISLLGPPFGDLGRRTQGRQWPYGLQELLLHFSTVHLETGPGAGKAVRTHVRPLCAARPEAVARLLWILGGSWLLQMSNVVAVLWLSTAALISGGSLYGALVLLTLAFPALLWQMLCRPGRLVWLDHQSNKIGNFLLFILTPLGMLGFVSLASCLHVWRLFKFLLKLRFHVPTGLALPVDMKQWYIYEAFREDARIFGDLPRIFLCAFALTNRLLLQPKLWPDTDMLGEATVASAECVALICAAASYLLGLIPARRQVSREAKGVVIQHVLNGVLR
ncbi:unnamed protein product [Symbiodinium pilosum]|uniref:Uncharacterized protein n=1 Tax=Symbiodinium pilosum TaxID=2952 RepID=A0A812Y4S7_SYMPI|nr:unnamed protein product [Symbiodinium pilosum]